MHPSVERIVTGGRLNPKARKIVTPRGFEFKSYSIGIGRYARVCVELDADLDVPGVYSRFHRATVRGVQVAPGRRGFVNLSKCLEAIEAEAIRQGIIDAEGKLINGGTDATQA